MALGYRESYPGIYANLYVMIGLLIIADKANSFLEIPVDKTLFHPSIINASNHHRQGASHPMQSKYISNQHPDFGFETPGAFAFGLPSVLSHPQQHSQNWNGVKKYSKVTDVLDTILDNYRSHESPGDQAGSTTQIVIFIHVLAISSIDVVKMEYSVDMILRQQWLDPRLVWRRVPRFRDYNQSILLTKHKHKLWLPDLFFRNAKRGFHHDISVPNYFIRVEPDGQVLYSQKITVTFSCSMYLRNFPMDSQECHMNIGSYGFELNHVQFVWHKDNPVTVADNLQLLEFDSPKGAKTSVSIICFFTLIDIHPF